GRLRAAMRARPRAGWGARPPVARRARARPAAGRQAAIPRAERGRRAAARSAPAAPRAWRSAGYREFCRAFPGLRCLPPLAIDSPLNWSYHFAILAVLWERGQ